jgi:hypothetical protein
MRQVEEAGFEEAGPEEAGRGGRPRGGRRRQVEEALRDPGHPKTFPNRSQDTQEASIKKT